jgi:TDG/mug DNA glycosylase family protein
MQQVGLPPILGEDTRVLILGSFPSERSLQQYQYYSNPTNDFWKLVGTAIDVDLDKRPYAAKIEILKQHRIGLWDVFRTCIRHGSKDGNIIVGEPNDFSILRMVAPNLQLTCLNGKKAAQHEHTIKQFGIPTKPLLSSSGANRKHKDVRLKQWCRALAQTQ